MITTSSPEFISFLASVQKLEIDYNAKNFSTLKPKQFSVDDGKRYIRVVREGSAHCFIDKTNGDVLKPASWKAPAKHARGNLFDASNGMANMGPYGPAYLR